ncbi:hypothetical protein LXA43DRAFT_1098374 [Ganoderma leucocontextum]|nr:hypothetical protein LXA43DRAFT_1098374 [Ganoderma leucocontextum]
MAIDHKLTYRQYDRCDVLIVTAAFAIPSSKERPFAERLARHSGGFTHQSQPTKLVSVDSVTESEALSGTASHLTDSENRCGAVLSESTHLRRPHPREPSGASGAHYAAAWAGIDSNTCGKAIPQTGGDFNVDGGSVSYDSALYEWSANNAYELRVEQTPHFGLDVDPSAGGAVDPQPSERSSHMFGQVIRVVNTLCNPER